VYCNYAGNVIVDNCYYSNAGNPGNLNLTATANASREWSGGVVGYCRGYITNSYAVATLNSLNTGHYIAGIAGILQGTAPQATLSNSYAAVAFNSHDDPQYDRPLYSSADNSDTLPINNVLYDYSTSEEGKYSNVPGDGTNGWGYWQQTGYGTTVQLQNYDQQLEMVYNGSTQIKPSPTTQAVLGSAFAKDDGATFYNGRYPILIWQSSLLNLPTYVPGDGTLNPPYEVGVFIDGVNGSDSNSGTSWTDPVLTVARALAVWAGGEATSNIYVLNTVTLTDGNALNLSGTAFEGVRFMRSASFAGVLFNVPGNVNAMMSAVLIDGNNTNISATKSLFDVTGGTLTVGFKAGLVNNVSSDGGAINVSSGSAAVTSGQLYNNYARRGGAVYVVEGASFTLNGTDGQINYNTAQNIGGAIASRGTVVIANGTITRNAVDSPGVGSGAYGGAIAAMGGSVTISGGTITYNSVISGNEGNSYGGAIYVDDTDGEGTTVAISGGNLNYNIALSGDNGKAYGGGLAFVNGYATISGGYLMENIVNVGSGIYAFGGGVYIAPGLTLNLNGGTIFGGIATRGQGIYADYSNSSGNTYIILNPTGSSVVSVSDTVYLITGALITQSGARFSIPNPLPASSISTPFSVQVDYPVQNVLVALAGTSSIASDSVQYFKTWRGVSMMVIANGIFYNSYDLAIE
jgi:predicted outer membrane repeat protein